MRTAQLFGGVGIYGVDRPYFADFGLHCHYLSVNRYKSSIFSEKD